MDRFGELAEDMYIDKLRNEIEEEEKKVDKLRSGFIKLQEENKNLNIHVSALIVENDSLKKALVVLNFELESYRSVNK